MEAVSITDLLDGQVVSDVLDLLPHRCKGILPLDAVPQDTSQRHCHRIDFRRVVQQRNTPHGLEHVVEEMRIHLCLQRPYGRLLLTDIHHIFVMDGGLQLVHEVVEAFSELGNFIRAVHLDALAQVLEPRAAHNRRQFFHWPADRPRGDRRDQNRNQQRKERRDHDARRYGKRIGRIGRLRYQGHDIPIQIGRLRRDHHIGPAVLQDYVLLRFPAQTSGEPVRQHSPGPLP